MVTLVGAAVFVIVGAAVYGGMYADPGATTAIVMAAWAGIAASQLACSYVAGDKNGKR